MRLFITLLLLAMPFGVYAERIEKSLDADPQGKLNIEVMSGTIKVVAWDKPMVRIEGKISGDSGELIFERKASAIRIEVEPSKPGFWGGWNNSEVNLLIKAPRQSQLIADGHSVDFNLIALDGSVRASTVSGDIDLDGGIGKIDLESVSGDINIKDAAGKLNLSSVSGDIRATATAKYFDAKSVSGDIKATIGMTERVELETVSGDIAVHLSLAEDARLDADTVSGDIDLSFENTDLNASFDIETGPGGDINNHLSDHKIKDQSPFASSLEFELGTGDAHLSLETMSGTIDLND